jgi:cation diffusion facilitator family transporter
MFFPFAFDSYVDFPRPMPIPNPPWSAPRKATLAASSAALLLILVKAAVGLSTGTVMVLASAVDSLLDFMVSAFNGYAVRTSEKPSDEVYNYGRGKIDGVASLLEGLFILASALYILREAILKFFSEALVISHQHLNYAMAAMAFSLVVTFALVLFLKKMSAISGNLIVKADTAHYQVDLLSNGGILIALLVIRFTNWNWVDPIIAVGVSLFVAKASIPLLRQGLDMLLDRALEESLVENIRQIVEFHLVFDENIKLREAHHISDEIEMRIRNLEKCQWILNIHLDPVDDSFRDIKLAKTKT